MPTAQKIRYSDVDSQAIVFNANYARYWDDAITDWFEELGFGGLEMGGIGVDVVTARVAIDFKATASFGDIIETSVAVERFGNTSMTLALVTTRPSDETLLVEGQTIYVFVDPKDLRPVPVPEEFKSAVVSESPPVR